MIYSKWEMQEKCSKRLCWGFALHLSPEWTDRTNISLQRSSPSCTLKCTREVLSHSQRTEGALLEQQLLILNNYSKW